ncbi:hypothetical protein HOLleu_06563 [Holothuria leucospilota]|uniref:Uncharacterized protein n=1 Tax=Holothuria leucospilota TaxID=206669 RepID=A0A9Q1CL30_HOLLE|nr:hypothetical protein HOLleu_06563 [Holothuria leucospilota]
MLSTPYSASPMRVTQRKGNSISAEGEDGSSITRNSSFFKRIDSESSESKAAPTEQSDNTVNDEPTELRRSKRNVKPPDRLISEM